MDVIVIGGGVVGTATAYYLSRAGASVTLLERNAAASLETSAGNAGLVSPSDSFAWASAAALKLAVVSLFKPELGIQFRPGFDPQILPWSLRFLNQCRPGKWRQNSDVKFRLAQYSRELMRDLEHDTGISFDDLDNGIVYACRDADALRSLTRHYTFMQDRGLTLETLDREALLALNPGLAGSGETYAGAVYSPDCKTGDSLKFSQALATWCEQQANCQFEWNTSVEKIIVRDGKIASLQTSKGPRVADAYVLCAGPFSAPLARQAGVRLPIYPVKGFSISAPITNPDLAPKTGFDDVQRLVAVSTLGDRLRIASSAVFNGHNTHHKPSDFKAILRLAHEVFPDAADYSRAEYWAGMRPMTPSSVPIIGTSRVPNLFLNTGHGHLGWTLACGSGQVVANLISGQKPEFEFGALI